MLINTPLLIINKFDFLSSFNDIFRSGRPHPILTLTEKPI